MPPCIMRIVELAGGLGETTPQDGQYVKEYIASGYGGRGLLEVTPDKRQAKTWPDAAMALAEWRRTSSTHPKRIDGMPNRPLTAYTVEILPAGDAP